MSNDELENDDPRSRVLRNALEHRVALVAYAWSLLRNHAAAEDAVQEAMLVIVRKYEQYQEGTSILAWCRSIVRLEVLKAQQKWHRQNSLVDRLLNDAVESAFEQFQDDRRELAQRDWQDALTGCLDKITEKSRRILHRRFAGGLSYNQIANEVGVSLESVRKTLFRSKQQLRACVESRINVGSQSESK